MLSKIQFDDFNMGIMGWLDCPNCKNPMLPIKRSKGIKIKKENVVGKDMGWSGIEDLIGIE